MSQIAVKPIAQLTITILPDGKTKVNGPLFNTKLCIAMLKEAFDAVQEFKVNGSTEQRSTIQRG